MRKDSVEICEDIDSMKNNAFYKYENKINIYDITDLF